MNAHVSLPTEEKFDADAAASRLQELKDTLKTWEEKYEERIKPLKEERDNLERSLLGYLIEINATKISTKHGTIHQITRKSASLPDPQAFMDYVIRNQMWDLIDRKANANAVEDYIRSHKAPPPGCDFKQAITLGFRRK